MFLWVVFAFLCRYGGIRDKHKAKEHIDSTILDFSIQRLATKAHCIIIFLSYAIFFNLFVNILGYSFYINLYACPCTVFVFYGNKEFWFLNHGMLFRIQDRLAGLLTWRGSSLFSVGLKLKLYTFKTWEYAPKLLGRGINIHDFFLFEIFIVY